MKHSVSIYAKALTDVVLEGKDRGTAAKNFLALLRRNGDERHLGKIIEESEILIRRKKGTRKITVESARKLDRSPRALLKDFAKPGDEISDVIRPELIAGMRIMVDGELQFDGSLKGKIDKLFG